MEELHERAALVTGGGSGVGLGLARALLEAGARVAIADLMPEHLAEAAVSLEKWSGRFSLHNVDVTDRASMAALASDIAGRHGPLHVLCPVAGVGVPFPTQLATFEDWDWVFGVNVGGFINALVTFLPGMLAHGGRGHIVAVGSIASVIPHHQQGIYTGSKFAVRGIAESLRLSLAGDGIGVTLVCPGLVRSRHLEAERTRPATLATGRELPQLPPDLLERANSAAMPADELGRLIVEAIRKNAPYVFSHPEIKQELEQVFAELLAAVPDPAGVPPERLAFEAMLRAGREEARRLASSPSPSLQGVPK